MRPVAEHHARRGALAGLLLSLAPYLALAHDGRHDAWYGELRQPDGSSCCNMLDCAPTDDWKPTADGYAVRIAGAWVPVPPERVIDNKGNPVGRAVLCLRAGPPPEILCFVPGAGA